MTPKQIASIKGMLSYFDSGNNIPVDKAVIKGNCAEVAALRAALAEPAPVQEPEMHEAMCPALTGGKCNCPTSPVSVDNDWSQFCGGIGRGPDAPYPGMIEAFEAHYAQSFADRDWRKETGVWAAAWKAAKAQPAPVQEPAKKGLFVDLIAQHPGLAENLMAIDAVPLPEWKPPPRLTDADVNKIYNKWVMGESDGTTFTDAIQTAVRKQFGVNVEAAPQASESVLTNASAQQPAPPANVPLLSTQERLNIITQFTIAGTLGDLIVHVEKLVRQKAGLK